MLKNTSPHSNMDAKNWGTMGARPCCVLVTLIILAVIIILVIWWMNTHNERVFLKENFSFGSPTAQLKRDVKSATPITEKNSVSEVHSATDARLEAAVAEAKKNVVRAKSGTLAASSDFELFNAKVDTMAEFGVTEEEVQLLVAQYEAENTFEVPEAPDTLTFDVTRLYDAADAMAQSAVNLISVGNPYGEDGLVDAMIKEQY